jgi:hypothetical protein
MNNYKAPSAGNGKIFFFRLIMRCVAACLALPAVSTSLADIRLGPFARSAGALVLPSPPTSLDGRPLRFATVSVDLHAPACRALRAACGSLPSGCPRRLGVLPAPNARLDPFTKRCRAGFGEASPPSRVGSSVFLAPLFSMGDIRMSESGENPFLDQATSPT